MRRHHLQYIILSVSTAQSQTPTAATLPYLGCHTPLLTTAIASPVQTPSSSLSLWILFWGFPHSSVSKGSACNAGDPGLIPGLRRFPGKRNGHPLQCSCLENSMDRGSWQLQFMGLQRLGHDWATHTFTFPGHSFQGKHRLLVGHSISISIHTTNCLSHLCRTP